MSKQKKYHSFFLKSIALITCLTFPCLSYSQQSQKIKTKLEAVYSAFDSKNASKGIQLTKEGIELALSQKDSSAVVTFCQMQSKFYCIDFHTDSAMNSLIRGNTFARKLEDKIKINHQIGEILLEIGSYEAAIPYLKVMVENEKMPLSKFYHFNLLGQAYMRNGNQEECAKNFKDQLLTAEKIGDKHLVINARNNLGFIYLAFKKYQQALPHLYFVTNALEGNRSLTDDDKVILTNAYVSLSNLHFHLNDEQKCIDYFDKAEQVLKSRIEEVGVQVS